MDGWKLAPLAGGMVAALVVSAVTEAQTHVDRFRRRGSLQAEEFDTRAGGTRPPRQFVEAPTGFDSLTNGYLDQGPPFDSITDDNVVPLRSFNDNRFIFEETETIEDGIGPVYNAQSCRECHQNVATGGASQVAEHRTGRLMGDEFFESLGGSLVHSRATHEDIVESVYYEDDVRTFRISTNTLGAGYIEAIPNDLFVRIRDRQPASMRGMAVMVPVLEADGAVRIGRFGWKSQHASLVSFSADAYLNEMGITSPLFPDENTSSGEYIGYDSEYDTVPDPEDDGVDVVAFADFMRATKAPSRGPITADVMLGEQLFRSVGCNVCHVETLRTSEPGAMINGGQFEVPEALGNKIFHPYSDFLLHNIGTGDGIPVLTGPEYASTANLIRTAPLWGLRTRNRLMHDGLSFTKREAVARHAGQATRVVAAFDALSDAEKELIFEFLDSL